MTATFDEAALLARIDELHNINTAGITLRRQMAAEMQSQSDAIAGLLSGIAHLEGLRREAEARATDLAGKVEFQQQAILRVGREAMLLRQLLSFDIDHFPGMEGAAIAHGATLGIDAVLMLEACQDVAAAGIAEVDAAFSGTAGRYTHVRRGGVYHGCGYATLQTEKPLPDGTSLVLYQGEDGSIWARTPAEFLDGRFLALPPPEAAPT